MTDQTDTLDEAPDDELDDDETAPVYAPIPGLPEFEGRRVGGLTTQIGGTRIDGGTVAHHGDQLVHVVVSTVDDVRHPTKDGTLVRTQIAKPTDTWAIIDPDYAEALIRSLRLRARRADDEAAGRTAMEVVTDASGVVLTPGDLASEAPLPEIPETPEDNEVVVIYGDGFRALWPDDFAGGARRPGVGDVDDEHDRVTELLDPVTGETLAEWSAEADAVADRETVDDLERRRIDSLLDGTVAAVVGRVKASESVDLLGRAELVEQQRKARKGVLDAIAARVGELTGEPF